MHGWIGKLLRVDLTTRRFLEEPLNQHILEHFMGGKGLATFYLYQEVAQGTDPFSPANRFYLATGPVQGTRIPITGRCTAVSKSPLTNLYIDSNIGGYIGPELKRAGFDMLIIQGQAEKPVWVKISPDETAILDAKSYWGRSTHETELALRKTDPKVAVLSLGPAGERQVRIASLTHNYFRTFGRGGLGAVLGAKCLKAIAIRGHPDPIETPDRDQELALIKTLARRARTAKQKGHSLHFHGTPWLVPYANTLGMFPTRNFQRTYFEAYKDISADSVEASMHHRLRRVPCEGCVISCAFTITKSFPWLKPEDTGIVAIPEYETLAMMGGNIGVADAETIIQLNHLCNILGLDTISTGNVIGLFMELTERGLLPENLQSVGIHFGDEKGAIQLVQHIATRRGVGDALAEGTRHFAQSLGSQAERLAIHGKGLEFPAWDPRGKLGIGLSYATAAAGASHLRGWPTTREPPNKSAIEVLPSLVEQQNLKLLKDALIVCHFTHSISPSLQISDCAKIFQTTTGIQATENSVTQIAERIWLLARLFNIREYEEPPRVYDGLPSRFMEEPVPDGPTKGLTAFVSHEDYERSLTELYRLRGCDADGRPTRAKWHELGLDQWIALPSS